MFPVRTTHIHFQSVSRMKMCVTMIRSLKTLDAPVNKDQCVLLSYMKPVGLQDKERVCLKKTRVKTVGFKSRALLS